MLRTNAWNLDDVLGSLFEHVFVENVIFLMQFRQIIFVQKVLDVNSDCHFQLVPEMSSVDRLAMSNEKRPNNCRSSDKTLMSSPTDPLCS